MAITLYVHDIPQKHLACAKAPLNFITDFPAGRHLKILLQRPAHIPFQKSLPHKPQGHVFVGIKHPALMTGNKYKPGLRTANAQLLCQPEPIPLRHLNIQKHQVKGLLLPCFI